MWGRDIKQKWGGQVEFVGLCDPNPKRAEVVRKLIGVECPVFTDFDRMLTEAIPDLLVITTRPSSSSSYRISPTRVSMSAMLS